MKQTARGMGNEEMEKFLGAAEFPPAEQPTEVRNVCDPTAIRLFFEFSLRHFA